jgi:hypothetical protein
MAYIVPEVPWAACSLLGPPLRLVGKGASSLEQCWLSLEALYKVALLLLGKESHKFQAPAANSATACFKQGESLVDWV